MNNQNKGTYAIVWSLFSSSVSSFHCKRIRFISIFRLIDDVLFSKVINIWLINSPCNANNIASLVLCLPRSLNFTCLVYCGSIFVRQFQVQLCYEICPWIVNTCIVHLMYTISQYKTIEPIVLQALWLCVRHSVFSACVFASLSFTVL